MAPPAHPPRRLDFMSSRRWSLGCRSTWISRLVGALGCLVIAASARAEWILGAGVEHFSWTEHTSPIRVKERGPLFAIRAGLTQPLGRDFAADFRARLYGGGVSYDGSLLFDPTLPVSATTHYLGWTLEPRLR